LEEVSWAEAARWPERTLCARQQAAQEGDAGCYDARGSRNVFAKGAKGKREEARQESRVESAAPRRTAQKWF